MSTAPQLKIGEVARRTGLTARTLRYSEDIGLLAPAVRDEVEPDDTALPALLEGMNATDPGISQRLTLLVYDDIEAAHDHLVTVFGFGPGQLTRDGDGRVVHGELHVGDGVVWMHPASPEHGLASPRTLGGSTHCMAVFVDDVDAHHERAVAAGAEITAAPRDMDYGVREYDARDPEGGVWSFMTSIDAVSDPDPRPDT